MRRVSAGFLNGLGLLESCLGYSERQDHRTTKKKRERERRGKDAGAGRLRESHSRTFFVKFTSVSPAPRQCLAAAAKSLQSCPTLCDPIDGSPPGSPAHGIL